MKFVKFGIAGLAAVGAVAGAALLFFEDPHAAEGRKLFSYYCIQCHGPKGQGNGFNAENLDPHPRDLTDSVEPYMGEATNEDIFSAVSYGVAGVAPVSGESKQPAPQKQAGGEEGGDDEGGIGSPLMPYFGFTLSEKEIWSLVAYVRTLHRNEAEPIEGWEGFNAVRPPVKSAQPPMLETDPKRLTQLMEDGKNLYSEKYGCSSCHRIGEEGGTVGPDLSRVGFRLQPKWIYQWLKSPQSILPETKMPNFALPDEEAAAITIYLSSLKGS
jgi:mono/diheme cytochrome c family protein